MWELSVSAVLCYKEVSNSEVILHYINRGCCSPRGWQQPLIVHNFGLSGKTAFSVYLLIKFIFFVFSRKKLFG